LVRTWLIDSIEITIEHTVNKKIKIIIR
jgi:hypothetical protein